MIGIKISLQDKTGIFLCVSEPYTKKVFSSDTTFVVVQDLHNNNIKEININEINKAVTEQEYARWNKS